MQDLEIEECIRAIRTRMHYGHTKKQIAEGLSNFFSQEMLFLCYHAAKILEDAETKQK